MPEDKVLSILKEGRDSHFDGQILDVFLSNLNEVNAIREKYSDKEEDFDKFADFKNINILELLK